MRCLFLQFGGGGGNRTLVRKHPPTASTCVAGILCLAARDFYRRNPRTAIRCLLHPGRRGDGKDYPAFITFVSGLAGEVRANGSLKREQLPVNMWQLYLNDRFFTRPFGQPRHATYRKIIPVETCAPPIFVGNRQ